LFAVEVQISGAHTNIRAQHPVLGHRVVLQHDRGRDQPSRCEGPAAFVLEIIGSSAKRELSPQVVAQEIGEADFSADGSFRFGSHWRSTYVNDHPAAITAN